jgi:hypothetical protein
MTDVDYLSEGDGRVPWDIGMRLAKSYAVGETAIIMEATAGQNRRKQEIICASNVPWDSWKYDAPAQFDPIEEALVKVWDCSQSNLMFVWSRDFPKEPEKVIPSSMAWTCPPWLKGLDDGSNPGCSIYGATTDCSALRRSDDFELIVEVVGIFSEREIGFGSVALAIKANRGCMYRLVESAARVCHDSIDFSPNSLTRSWEAYLYEFVSSFRFGIIDDRRLVRSAEIR